MNRTGAKVEFVPYRGAAPALQALLSGEADINITQIGGVIQRICSGKLRATAKTCQNAAPEIPTADKLNAAIVDTLADTTVRTRFTDIGQDIPPREEQTPQSPGALHKAEIDKWWPLMRAAGIKLE